MNFIYSIIAFALFSAISFLLSGITEGNPGGFFYIAGFGLGIVSVIFIGVGFFNNLEIREWQKRDIARIRTTGKEIALKEKLMADYKKEMGDSLTKVYPEYEKEMFKNMTPTDAENLNIFLAKYPELKFNGVLGSYTDKLTEMLKDISETKRHLEGTYENIKVRNENDWYLLKIKIPEKIQKAIEE